MLAIHNRQLTEHGGGEGLRDETLLQSALARPPNNSHARTAILSSWRLSTQQASRRIILSSMATSVRVSWSAYFFSSSMAIVSRLAKKRRRRLSSNLPRGR